MSQKLRKLLGIMLVVFVIGSVAGMFLATYLILFSIDPKTHFYYDGAKLVGVTNAVLLIVTVLLLIPFFTKKIEPEERFRGIKNTPLAAMSALTGASLIFCGIYNIGITISKAQEAGPLIIGGTEVFASIFFILASISQFTGKKSDLRIAGLLPVVFGGVNLIVTFMGLTQVANISEYLYEVLEMVFAAIFFYYNSRLISGLSNGREIHGVFAFGLPCAFYGLLTAFPPIIAHIINNNVGSAFMVQDTLYIALTAYIIVLLTQVLKLNPIKKNS